MLPSLLKAMDSLIGGSGFSRPLHSLLTTRRKAADGGSIVSLEIHPKETDVAIPVGDLRALPCASDVGL
jgi:hypothetical protein